VSGCGIFGTTPGRSSTVAAGESIVITVDGRPAAELRPLGTRPRSVRKESLIAFLQSRQAEPTLRSELRELVPDTTDDLPL
jgi:antitoxin (DNA-binding transcriptional repressor) of toxin-antitoxin stability system